MASSGSAPLDDGRRGAGGLGGRDEVVAVDVLAGDRDEQRARPDRARVVGDAADGDGREAARPIARPSRRAPRSRPAAVSRSMSPSSAAGSVGSAAASRSAIVASVGSSAHEPRRAAHGPTGA